MRRGEIGILRAAEVALPELWFTAVGAGAFEAALAFTGMLGRPFERR